MSDNPNPTPTDGAAGAAPQRQVLLQKIYCKDASLEVPLAPQVFTRQWQPQVDVQVNTDIKPLDGDNFHVVLAVTVTAKLGEDVAFLAEAHQAGIFVVRGFATNEERQAILGGYCPGLIFPFARETIAEMVQRGGFPQLLLQPINFEALYLEHLNRARAQQKGGAPAQPAATPTH
ncbi:MAG: protein-export chaperone SecB [Sinimarinibacterium flocculans]|uniref:Protein-export protein SecB n=1 Tax=Sinimarinibacterium flocculans TaxID=985250 RepID=A0A318ED73_9GAMM|nr:protein-export chaperone SecB [Sinimarinibacterium flocculans]PXV70453.1 protein translocase subunit secB [Sinimarinibacterium flocculans]